MCGSVTLALQKTEEELQCFIFRLDHFNGDRGGGRCFPGESGIVLHFFRSIKKSFIL